jgi:cell division protein FtsW
MAEPDLETAGLIVAIAGVMLVAAGLPGRIIGFASVVLMLVGAAGIASAGYRRGRFIAWLDPMADPSNYGYQTVQGYLALGSGGINGVGLGQGRGKWLWIPNAHTDYIFAIIGEELGLLGATFVLVLFTLLAVGGIRTARSAPDAFGRLLAVGITAWLLLQAVINIGSVVGLLPVTGVTLPLLSFGGSSLVLTMIGVGLLLSVARHARPPGAKVVA